MRKGRGLRGGNHYVKVVLFIKQCILFFFPVSVSHHPSHPILLSLFSFFLIVVKFVIQITLFYVKSWREVLGGGIPWCLEKSLCRFVLVILSTVFCI